MIPVLPLRPFLRHGEARSAVAIQRPVRAALDGHAPSGLAMTDQYSGPLVYRDD